MVTISDRGVDGGLKGGFSGFGTGNINRELLEAAGGPGMGDLGSGSGVGGHLNYVNISGLSLGLAMGVNRSYSIWSDRPKEEQVFSPLMGRGLWSQVGMTGLGEDFCLSEHIPEQGRSQERKETHQDVQHMDASSRENIYLARVNNPTFVPQVTARPEKKVRSASNKQLIVKLPAATREIRKCPKFRDNLLRENNDINNEDYCSTFYKRNSLGYMFIKEPSNSLKVNNSGPRSWVQLKIKFPETSNTKKLKVDIKQLPFWKPINNNPKDKSRAKKSPRDKKKSNFLKLFNNYNKGDSHLQL